MSYVRDRRATLYALDRVGDERDRQERKLIAGAFRWTCADAERTNEEKLPILAEEFGEVARAIIEGDHTGLRDELLHVAAVAVAWFESLPAAAAVKDDPR